MPTRKTEETWRCVRYRRKPTFAAEFFFSSISRELDNFESFETSVFFLKKNPLVFAFDTCYFSKIFKKKFGVFVFGTCSYHMLAAFIIEVLLLVGLLRVIGMILMLLGTEEFFCPNFKDRR